ncbi:hypothetical protein ACSQ67_003344 [Phaseolus vulgaris]
MSSSSYTRSSSTFFYLFLAVFVAKSSFCFSAKVYVVYMGSKTGEDPDDILKQNHQMLAAVHRGSVEQARASHVYSYRHGFRGFAAKLTNEQAHQISKMPGVVSVFPNTKRKLHTTHSWDFMGLLNNESMEIHGYSTKNQENVIIGFIDTGEQPYSYRIWPESPSFRDTDMQPVPQGWKGHCQLGEAFNASSCNRKVIGARYYMSGHEAEEGSLLWNQGESLSLLGMNASTRLMDASQAFAGYFTPYQSSYCVDSSLNKTKATGKVLVCRHAEYSSESKLEKSRIVKEAGAVGMILIDEANQASYYGEQHAFVKDFQSKDTTVLDKHHQPIRADPDKRRANAFDYGSGFVNPTKVLDPGLVYDSHPNDFVAFLCSLGYDERSLRLVTRDNSTCDRAFKTPSDLNYPSIAVPNLEDIFSVTRVVTNVGKARSIYRSVVLSPAGVNVTVVPNRLVFTRVGQKIKFNVTFKVAAPSKGYAFGFLSWKNRISQVTSPLVVRVAPASLGLVR